MKNRKLATLSVAALLQEHSKWQRRETIARNKLAATAREILDRLEAGAAPKKKADRKLAV